MQRYKSIEVVHQKQIEHQTVQESRVSVNHVITIYPVLNSALNALAVYDAPGKAVIPKLD